MTAAALPGILATGAAVAGTGMQYAAAEQARSRANRATDAVLASNSARSQKQADLLSTRAPEIYNPQTLVPEREVADATLTSDLSKFLEAVKYPTSSTAGTTSNDWLRARAQNAVSEKQRAADLNRLWARLHAPSQVELTRSLEGSKMFGDLSDINSDRSASQPWDAMKINQAGQPDGAALLGGKLLASGGTTVLGHQLAKG